MKYKPGCWPQQKFPGTEAGELDRTTGSPLPSYGPRQEETKRKKMRGQTICNVILSSLFLGLSISLVPNTGPGKCR
jgi:hypothetical protein